MSEYYAVERSLPHLTHAGNGSARNNHKYLLRVRDGDSYRYFYTWKEVAEYQNGKNTGTKVEDDAAKYETIKNRVGKTIDKAKQAVSDASGLTAKKNIKKYDNFRIAYANAQSNYYQAGNTGPGYQEARAGNELYQRKVRESRDEYKRSPLGKVDKASAKLKKAMHSVNRKISDASANVAKRQNASKAENSVKKYNSAMSQKLKNTTDLAKAVVSKDALFTPGGGYERRLAGQLARDRAQAIGAQARYKAVKNASGSKTRPHQRKKKVVSGTVTVKRR